MFAKVNFIVPLDQVCLGDSCLIVEVEKDYTVYGDELKFGGGKVSSYFVIKNHFFFLYRFVCETPSCNIRKFYEQPFWLRISKIFYFLSYEPCMLWEHHTSLRILHSFLSKIFCQFSLMSYPPYRFWGKAWARQQMSPMTQLWTLSSLMPWLWMQLLVL